MNTTSVPTYPNNIIPFPIIPSAPKTDKYWDLAFRISYEVAKNQPTIDHFQLGKAIVRIQILLRAWEVTA